MPRKKVTKDNRIQLPDGRYYESDGKKLPSVTTLLGVLGKPALIPWAAKLERNLVIDAAVGYYQEMYGDAQLSQYRDNLEARIGKARAHQKALKEAGDIGTEAHAMVEWELKRELGHACELDQPKITHPAAQMAYEAWRDWRKQVKLRPVAAEQVVLSSKYGYAGTLDLSAYAEDVLTIFDWKSGRSIYPEALGQNAAYRQAYREMGCGDPKKGMIVRLPKVDTDPGFEVADAGDEATHFQTFLAAQQLWKWLKMAEKELKVQKDCGKMGSSEEGEVGIP